MVSGSVVYRFKVPKIREKSPHHRFLQLVDERRVDLEVRRIKRLALDVLLLGGIGLDIAGVQEAVEDIEGFLGRRSGFLPGSRRRWCRWQNQWPGGRRFPGR